MTYIKNSRPIKAFQNLSLYKLYTYKTPNLAHFQILGSTVYVFLQEEEQMLKSKKWAPRALKETLVAYNGHTIYQVYLKNQKKIIRVKDLCVLKTMLQKALSNSLIIANITQFFKVFFFETMTMKKMRERFIQLTQVVERSLTLRK